MPALIVDGTGYLQYMGNELIPERRMNKLGHFVTKHVKRLSVGRGPATSIPQPVMAPDPVVSAEAARSKLARDAAAAIAETVNRRGGGSGDNRWNLTSAFHREISSYAASTLERILDSDPVSYTQLGEVLFEGWDERFVNDFIALAPLVLRPRWWTSGDSQRCLEGFAYCDGLTPLGESGEYPAERFEQCKALYTVTMHLVHRGENVREFTGSGKEINVIKDERLRNLLLSSELDRDVVVSIITERDIFNPDHIRELMNMDVRLPLLDGRL